MTMEQRFPRGHAYVRMRVDGYSVDIDYPTISSDQARRIMDAVMRIVREDAEAGREEPGQGEAR